MIDSHCHLADEVFEPDLEQVVARAKAAKISRLLCIVSAEDDAEQARSERLAQLWDAVWFAVGVHPHKAGRFAADPQAAAGLVDAALKKSKRARAVGEIGLDYHYDFSPRAIQREVFRAQIRLARERGLPIVIHTREADDDTFGILENEGQGDLSGVFHCFTGDATGAGRVVALGFSVSFAGILTFPRAVALRQTARVTPDDRILIETDSPYLAPVPYRGQRNEPALVAETLATLAHLRSETVEGLTRTLEGNFDRLFLG